MIGVLEKPFIGKSASSIEVKDDGGCFYRVFENVCAADGVRNRRSGSACRCQQLEQELAISKVQITEPREDMKN